MRHGKIHLGLSWRVQSSLTRLAVRRPVTPAVITLLLDQNWANQRTLGSPSERSDHRHASYNGMHFTHSKFAVFKPERMTHLSRCWPKRSSIRKEKHQQDLPSISISSWLKTPKSTSSSTFLVTLASLRGRSDFLQASALCGFHQLCRGRASWLFE